MLKCNPYLRMVGPGDKAVAVKNEGIVELADQLLAHYDFLQQSGLLAKQRAARAQVELNELLRSRIMQELGSSTRPCLLRGIDATDCHRETIGI